MSSRRSPIADRLMQPLIEVCIPLLKNRKSLEPDAKAREPEHQTLVTEATHLVCEGVRAHNGNLMIESFRSSVHPNLSKRDESTALEIELETDPTPAVELLDLLADGTVPRDSELRGVVTTMLVSNEVRNSFARTRTLPRGHWMLRCLERAGSKTADALGLD